MPDLGVRQVKTSLDSSDIVTATRGLDSAARPEQVNLQLASIFPVKATFPVVIGPLELMDGEATTLTTGVKFTFYAPYVFTLTNIQASARVASTSGPITLDLHMDGTTVMATTKVTLDVDEATAETAATEVITTAAITANAKLEIEVDAAGTGASGVKVFLIGTRVLA